MTFFSRLWLALAALTLIAGGGAGVAAEAGLSVARHGDWTVEIVVDGGRAACSALIEREGGAAAFVQLTSDSPFVLPVFETLSGTDPLDPEAPLMIVVGALAVEAHVEVTSDEDGVYVAAYPDIDAAKKVIAAMETAEVLRLTVRGATVSVLPLNGFDRAYAEAARVCVG